MEVPFSDCCLRFFVLAIWQMVLERGLGSKLGEGKTNNGNLKTNLNPIRNSFSSSLLWSYFSFSRSTLSVPRFSNIQFVA